MTINPIIILGIGGGLAFLLLLIGIIVSITSERSIVEERLGQIAESGRVIEPEKRRVAATPLTDWLNKRVEGSSWAEKISKNLARADIKMKPGEYIALLIISAFVVGVFGYFVGGRSMLIALLGAGGGFFVARFICQKAAK